LTNALTRPPLPVAVWWICAGGAPVVAWCVAKAGYGIAIASPWPDLAMLALASVLEEIVFRGGLQRLLRRWSPLAATQPVSGANLLTSVAFAALHLWHHPALAALGVLPVSLLLGWTYERSGERLLAPVLLHMYFNAVLAASSYAIG